MKLTLGQIADIIHAEGDFTTSAEALGYSIDSRTISAGELFFAVTGERVDGHDFVEAALRNGAIAAVVSNRWLASSDLDPCKLLWVPESEDCVLKAMQTLAREVRRRWGRRVIGVTGSAGKTTTKEAIATVLSARFNTFKSAGNLNNHFGVPLQLLRLEPEHEVAVIEMGMNHAGEIATLCRIAEPDWGVVSNVGEAHIEFFPDGLAGIARAKKELIDALPPNGIAFLNGDNEWVAKFGEGFAGRSVIVGWEHEFDVSIRDFKNLGFEGLKMTVVAGSRTSPLHLHLIGPHNVSNALSAIAVGVESGIPLAECCFMLEQMRPPSKRGELHCWNGARIIDDTYNSNPDALISMARALASTQATRRIAIVGEMLELGADGPRLHAEAGHSLAGWGADIVVGVRGLARELVQAAGQNGAEAIFLETPAEAGAWMRDNLREGDAVLLKASRGVRLEAALEALSDAKTA
jgi:UDP-N-acetylmuramoyl-tripeptide--D-alanyl-D-alanine ligase